MHATPPRSPWLAVAMPLILLILMVGCGGSDEPPAPSPTPTPTPAPTHDILSIEISGAMATLVTDQGPQDVQLDGMMEILAAPPDAQGMRTLMVTHVGLGTSSAPVMGGETGGMSYLLGPSMGGGLWDTNRGTFQVQFDLDVSYWLLDELIPPSEEHVDVMPGNALESWTGNLGGMATLDATGLMLDATLGASTQASLTNGPASLTWTETIRVLVNAAVAAGCPREKQCRKKVVCIQPIFIGTGAADPSRTGTSFDKMKAEAESIWGKCCVEFDWMAPKYINNNAYKEIESFDMAAGRTERNNLRAEEDATGNNDCIEVFFVDKFTKGNGDAHAAGDGVTVGSGLKSAKVIVSDAAVDECNPDSDRVLAHELGHAMGNLPHRAGTCMQASGNPPNCPGRNPSDVSKDECKGLGNPLFKVKMPVELCCKNWDKE